MYRFMLSARWAVIVLLALVLIPTMVRLGFWQYHRHEARVARNDLVARNLGSPPVAFDSLSSPGWSVPGDQVWRTVTAQGHYDTAHEVVVRGRTEPGGSSIGYFVLTPLVLADGKGSVLVNRGWVESAADAASLPAVPAPPSGDVTVTGRLRADETYASLGVKNRGGLPDRMYKVINSAEQAKYSGAPVLGGYLELASSQPAAGASPTLLAEPGHSDIGPHMAYAIQWWLFTTLIPVGLVVLARREAKQQAAQPAKAEELVGATS
ncbi:SURF1 family protein [Kitasatospora cheerisanensis]|uniref:SURF1 family cytochrome oxidase biogenesis protein n=1 Tax=Kitasatospora cheerisanensis TaxID=81942 RepID=UPI0005618895|nr:SURF1 family protein [Kitasatospora cheerisanensis]